MSVHRETDDDETGFVPSTTPTTTAFFTEDDATNETLTSTGSDGGGLLINIIIFYYPPLIVFLGIVGNLLSLAVFRYTKLRQLSTSCYLTALSLSDTGCLLPYLATWLEIVGVSVYNRAVSCQLLTYLFYVCGFMSPWFVVAFTVERFVATCYPLRRAAICTVSRAQAIVLVLVLIAALSYVYIPFVTGIDESRCVLKQHHLDTMNVLNFLDTVATLIVPGVLITGLNLLIARAVLRIEKVQCNLMMIPTTTTTTSRTAKMTKTAVDRSQPSSDDDDDPGNDDDVVKSKSTASLPTKTVVAKSSSRNHFIAGHHHHQKRVRGCYQMKITKMLLLISTVFVVLNAPSYIVRLWVYFAAEATTDVNADTDNVLIYNLQQWSQLPFNLNFAINFLLYCVSGQNFRRSLKMLFYKVMGRVGGRHHRYGRRLSVSSSKRTVTVGSAIGAITSSVRVAATSTTNSRDPVDRAISFRTSADATAVIVVVDAV